MDYSLKSLVLQIVFQIVFPGPTHEFLFHLIRCQNTTLQVSKRKQVFSFEDGKVIFMLKSEAILVDFS